MTKQFGRLLQAMLLLAFTATAAGLASTPARGAAAQNPSKDERAIRAVAAHWQQDWNRHDYKALGNLFAVDGDYVTDAGVWLRGRQEFIDWHVKHAAMFRNSSWTNNELTLRFLQPEVAILHLTWGLKGDLDEKGAPLPGRPGISTWLLVKIGGHWKIRSVQDTTAL